LNSLKKAFFRFGMLSVFVSKYMEMINKIRILPNSKVVFSCIPKLLELFKLLYLYLIERNGNAFDSEQSELESSACKSPMFHVPAYSEELGRRHVRCG